ncbi:MAG: protein kinase, partial [Planctomycetes bacterium]|nr:protein kinase [Planctomycetota bacterium]
MSDASGQSALRRQQFDEILAEYLDAVDGGAPPELDELLMRYPDFEPELHEFFADQSRVGGLAAAFRVRSSDVLPITEDYRAPVPAATEIGSFDLQPAEIERQKIEIGSVFAGDYRIFDVKAGGMGRVYLADWLLARSHGSEVRVAIKTVADFSVWKRSRQSKVRPIDEGIYRDIVRRFEREADAWIHIEPHDNILQAFFVIDVGAKPYLVMDYADSGDLQSWIAAGRMTVPLAVNFAIQFCRGMAHVVRTAGMVHRDIKPANVLVKDDRIVKIADFGLSKSLDILADDSAGGTAGTGESAMSQAGGGTLPYMAPEQFGSLSAADTRSDVFSFGAMFYEMLTSRRLFEAANVTDHLVLRIRPAPAAHELNPEVPEVLSALIARCVSYDPEHRYQSFDEILADLTRACDTIPDHPSIPSDPRPVSPESRFVQETYSLVGLCNYEKAAQRADEGLSQFPQQVELLINKGKALFHLGDADGAMECTRQALAIRPRHTRAWANLAFLHLERNEPAEALEAAENATRHDPDLAPGWHARGWCEHMLGHSEKGAQSLRRAVKLEPHNWQTPLALGRCLTRLGKDGEALRTLKRAAS